MPDGANLTIEPLPAPGATPIELLVWLSPAFPVGAFAFSHGLEKLVELGIVSDRASLEVWLRDLALRGSLHNDLVLLAATWRAAVRNDDRALDEIAQLAAALQPSAERQLETLTQGGAFTAAITTAWDSPAMQRLLERHALRIAYPVAVGVATGGQRIDLAATLEAYAVAFATNIVSAAIRLSVIGQFDGQRTLAGLLADLRSAARHALSGSLDDLGTAMLASDLASLLHETQYTRLFRS